MDHLALLEWMAKLEQFSILMRPPFKGQRPLSLILYVPFSVKSYVAVCGGEVKCDIWNFGTTGSTRDRISEAYINKRLMQCSAIDWRGAGECKRVSTTLLLICRPKAEW